MHPLFSPVQAINVHVHGRSENISNHVVHVRSESFSVYIIHGRSKHDVTAFEIQVKRREAHGARDLSPWDECCAGLDRCNVYTQICG
jgi:hypothetical protein